MNYFKPTSSKVPVQMYAETYSAYERDHLHQEFMLLKRQREAMERKIALPLAAVFALIIGSAVLLYLKIYHPILFILPFVGALLFFILLPLLSLLLPKLVCPSCSNALEDWELRYAFGHYCPECGGRDTLFQKYQGGSVAQCVTPGCGKTLEYSEDSQTGYRTRSYTIRYCTYCGLKLDNKGL